MAGAAEPATADRGPAPAGCARSFSVNGSTAWLGVDRRFAGRGLGTKLFARALADGVRVYHIVRFVAIVIDAITEQSFVFYQRMGFFPVPGTVDKLYLPATTLLQVTALAGEDR